MRLKISCQVPCECDFVLFFSSISTETSVPIADENVALQKGCRVSLQNL